MKRILTTLSQKWPEYLLEILVITIGILGAFALNNWNENRKAQVRRKAMVENLLEEYYANLVQLDTVLYYDQLSAKSSVSLMELMKKKDFPPEEELDSTFLNICHLWSYDPSFGALQSAVSAGDVHLISNKKLVKYLFNWEGLVNDSKEEETRLIDHHLKAFPQFYNRIQNANTYRAYEKRIPKSMRNSNYEALLTDPLFENFLADKILWAYDAERELLAVRSRLVEVIELLKAE